MTKPPVTHPEGPMSNVHPVDFDEGLVGEPIETTPTLVGATAKNSKAQVLPFPRRTSPPNLSFRVDSVLYTPDERMHICNAILRKILTKVTFESSAQALSEQKQEHEKAKSEILFHLRPLMVKEAITDAANNIFRIRKGMPFDFPSDFRDGFRYEFFNTCTTDEVATRSVFQALRKIHYTLVWQYGVAIQSGASTALIKRNKDIWKAIFKDAKIPNEFKARVYLLLEAFVEHYICCRRCVFDPSCRFPLTQLRTSGTVMACAVAGRRSGSPKIGSLGQFDVGANSPCTFGELEVNEPRS